MLQPFPVVKEIVKKVYQWPQVLLTSEPTVNNVQYRFWDAFLGFHDVTPWNRAGTKFLIHQTNKKRRDLVTVDDMVNISYVDLENNEQVKVGSSSAFNWQQGSRLQWVGASDVICFNYNDEGELKACLYDCATGEKKTLPAPAYSWCDNGEVWVSTNFAVIEKYMPGYGYVGKYDEYDIAGSFSIWEKTAGRCISSIKLADFLSVGLDLKPNEYFVSHFQFSPGGKDLAFFVRQQVRKDWFKTYFLVYNLKNKNLDWFENIDGSTHFAWTGDNSILIYMRHGMFSQFCQLDIASKKIHPSTALSHLPDGHPHRDGDKVVIDTYPDARRNQRLFLYDLTQKTLKEINSIRSPMKYSGYSRIDMHPKLRLSDRLVAFDAGKDGKHSVYVCKF
jgi:hypothetical protein